MRAGASDVGEPGSVRPGAATGISKNGSSLPETRSCRKMVPRPVRNVVKTMVRSSGDQTGSASSAGSSVSRDEMPVATSTTQMSALPVSVSMRCTAARDPLGDSTTCWKYAGRADDAGVPAVARHPRELAAAAAAGAIDESALVGDREGAAGDLLCNRHGRSETLERRGIEALRHERLLPVEEQVVRRRKRCRRHRGEHVARRARRRPTPRRSRAAGRTCRRESDARPAGSGRRGGSSRPGSHRVS